MLIRRPPDLNESDVTPESIYRERRRFLTGAGLLGLAAATNPAAAALKLGPITKIAPSGDDQPTAYEDATGYNNFYELGLDKEAPAQNAHLLKTEPWNVVIDGEVERPGTIGIEDLIKPHALEERIYRLRCVEAWSMVIPWVGFPLGDLLKRFGPTSRAKYVAFTSILDPENLPGQRRAVLEWPYAEGLRIDEAMHPLTLMAVGLYGRELPNQNGAPIRLVVPWKYGFKSAKSIVRITLTETEPKTAWNLASPGEYGFYANVNPGVNHPRWSQRRERRIGDFLRRDTLMFNGYGEQVASLYDGMDLTRSF